MSDILKNDAQSLDINNGEPTDNLNRLIELKDKLKLAVNLSPIISDIVDVNWVSINSNKESKDDFYDLFVSEYVLYLKNCK